MSRWKEDVQEELEDIKADLAAIREMVKPSRKSRKRPAYTPSPELQNPKKKKDLELVMQNILAQADLSQKSRELELLMMGMNLGPNDTIGDMI